MLNSFVNSDVPKTTTINTTTTTNINHTNKYNRQLSKHKVDEQNEFVCAIDYEQAGHDQCGQFAENTHYTGQENNQNEFAACANAHLHDDRFAGSKDTDCFFGDWNSQMRTSKFGQDWWPI